jgi:hypothetical protein
MLSEQDWCICARLRACEQRVTERWESLHGWGESYAYKTGSDNGFEVGYTAGLDAAEAAVADMVIETVGNSAATVSQALATIDALREET